MNRLSGGVFHIGRLAAGLMVAAALLLCFFLQVQKACAKNQGGAAVTLRARVVKAIAVFSGGNAWSNATVKRQSQGRFVTYVCL